MAVWDILSRAISGSWDLYNKSGSSVVPFDTFFSVDVVNETKVTNCPTEPNGFASYNKVQSPAVVNVVVGISGNAVLRGTVISALEELAAGTELLSIVTPEKTFTDYSLESFDYQRSAEDGLDRLKVSLRLVEIRQVSPEYSNETIPAPKNEADSKTQNVGKQTTNKADSSTKKAVESKSETRNAGKRQSILSAMTS